MARIEDRLFATLIDDRFEDVDAIHSHIAAKRYGPEVPVRMPPSPALSASTPARNGHARALTYISTYTLLGPLPSLHDLCATTDHTDRPPTRTALDTITIMRAFLPTVPLVFQATSESEFLVCPVVLHAPYSILHAPCSRLHAPCSFGTPLSSISRISCNKQPERGHSLARRIYQRDRMVHRRRGTQNI